MPIIEKGQANPLFGQFQMSARPQSIVARICPRLPTIELSRRASHPDTVLLLSFGWPLGIYWV